MLLLQFILLLTLQAQAFPSLNEITIKLRETWGLVKPTQFENTHQVSDFYSRALERFTNERYSALTEFRSLYNQHSKLTGATLTDELIILSFKRADLFQLVRETLPDRFNKIKNLALRYETLSLDLRSSHRDIEDVRLRLELAFEELIKRTPINRRLKMDEAIEVYKSYLRNAQPLRTDRPSTAINAVTDSLRSLYENQFIPRGWILTSQNEKTFESDIYAKIVFEVLLAIPKILDQIIRVRPLNEAVFIALDLAFLNDSAGIRMTSFANHYTGHEGSQV